MPTMHQTLDWHTMANKALLKNETRYLCHYSKPHDDYIILIRIGDKWYDGDDAEGQPFADPDEWAELKKDESTHEQAG